MYAFYLQYKITILLVGAIVLMYLIDEFQHRFTPQPPTTIKCGNSMVKLTILSITRIKYSKDFLKYCIVEARFPPTLSRFIKKIGPLELSKILMQIQDGEMTNAKKDLCRAITISAALFDNMIPKQLVLLDERTKALFGVLEQELSLVEVPLMRSDTIAAGQLDLIPVDYREVNSRYRSQVKLIGATLLLYASALAYPSFENFAASVRLNRKLPISAYSDDEIKSLTTAFAALTNFKLPISYVVYDSLAIALMNPSNPPKLAIVQ